MLPDHKNMMIACTTEAEAHYLAGVINSTPFRFAVASYAVGIQLDPHLVANLRIPGFEPDDRAHAAVSDRAAKLSADETVRTPARLEDLDRLCAQLWGITDEELAEVRKEHAELYHRTPVLPLEDEDGAAE